VDTARFIRPLAFVALGLTAGCGDAPPGPDPAPTGDPAAASLQITPRDLLVLEGAFTPLTATVRDTSGAVLERDIEWSAFPPDIVAVSGDGVLQGVGLGTGYVAAASGDAGDTAAVAVRVRFASLSAGAAHTCGITTRGALYCWGWNREGRLGTGTLEPVASPARARSAATFFQVSAGWEITCGLSATGAACWGSNRSGQLGSAAKADALAPAPVVADPSLVAISTQTTHSCGIAGRDREAWCWGAGWAGQRGDGAAADGPPVPVAGSRRFRALEVGWLFTCGVTEGGAALCWGTNDAGQLGRPDAPDVCAWPSGASGACARTPVAVAAGLRWDAIAVGTSHACALATDGAAHCWGRNDAGQVGDGSADAVAATPRPVAGGLSFRLLSAGDRHACALDADGAAWCWGHNASGALGTGAAAETCGGVPCSRVPVRVATTLRFRTLTASRGEGGAHTCGLDADGLAWCWGANGRGQLGVGSLGSGGAAPRLVAGQMD